MKVYIKVVGRPCICPLSSGFIPWITYERVKDLTLPGHSSEHLLCHDDYAKILGN